MYVRIYIQQQQTDDTPGFQDENTPSFSRRDVRVYEQQFTDFPDVPGRARIVSNTHNMRCVRGYLVRESHRLPKPERQSHFHDTRAVICQQQKRSREIKTGCKLLGPLVPHYRLGGTN